eukprot:9469191-Pyramimonas_sp.AAC.2
MSDASSYPPYGDGNGRTKDSEVASLEYGYLLQEIIETFKVRDLDDYQRGLVHRAMHDEMRDHPEQLKELRLEVDRTRSTNNDMIINLRNTLWLLYERIHKYADDRMVVKILLNISRRGK